MSRGFPSMTALLGLLAIAGYQNRDKIAEMLRGLGQTSRELPGKVAWAACSASWAAVSAVPVPAGSSAVGSANSWTASSRAAKAKLRSSWVGTGPNKAVTPSQLEQAIGPEVLDTLSKQTGLSRDELLARLSRELPDAVDKYTPQGRLPTEAEFSRS